ncbi:LysM peptidoglycan-binding domain-containing protein [Paenarthrobacter sp. NPDC018779]|uniref:LysM peptidoglycan-binding domain-containing protein n=1 Tax=Paenarthrobacter sp. NPDC018779 TaxID=3364375 RepID=UPI0037CC6F23
MGFLDNVKKNLGLGHKDHAAGESAARQAAEDAAAVEVSASDTEAAEAAAAQAAEQQEAATAAATQEAHDVGLEPSDPEVRQAGQDAAVEAAAGAGQPGRVAPRVTEVVVEPGDTMGGIAAQFKVDLGALIATNADKVPNPDAIYPGQVLRLP